MPRTTAGGRDDYGQPKPDLVQHGTRTRNYGITGPHTQEYVVQWLMANGGDDWPRWRAVAATAIAIAMRSNSEPIPGGLVIIRVVPGGFELEERTGRG